MAISQNNAYPSYSTSLSYQQAQNSNSNTSSNQRQRKRSWPSINPSSIQHLYQNTYNPYLFSNPVCDNGQFTQPVYKTQNQLNDSLHLYNVYNQSKCYNGTDESLYSNTHEDNVVNDDWVASLYKGKSEESNSIIEQSILQKYQYTLDAPTTRCMDLQTCTFLNRGQEYQMTFECLFANNTDSAESTEQVAHSSDEVVKSLITVSFAKVESEEICEKYWAVWTEKYKEQPLFSVVDAKSVGLLEVRLLAINAVEVTWRADRGAQLLIVLHCLSTDFSYQKGVKGIPLRLGVETAHCASSVDDFAECQIKTFRDKGAYRKSRDVLRQAEHSLHKVAQQHYLSFGYDALHYMVPVPKSVQPVTVLIRKIPKCTPKPLLRSSNLKCASLSNSSTSSMLLSESTADDSAKAVYLRRADDVLFSAAAFSTTDAFFALVAKAARVQLDSIDRIGLRVKSGIYVTVQSAVLQDVSSEQAFVVSVEPQKGQRYIVYLDPVSMT